MTFNNAINSSLSSMNEAARRTGVVSGNISNTETSAFKRMETYNMSVVNSQSGSVGGVSSSNIQLVDQQGELRRTNISTDLSIEGAGFAIVTNGFTSAGTPKDIFFTRDLSFRKDQTDRLVNPSGYYLLSWGVNADGKLPDTKSLLSSLVDVNVTKWVSAASATTKINFGANLESSENVVGNGVKTISISNRGLTGSRYNFNLEADDILYANPANSLTKGEGIEITMIQPGGIGKKTTQKILFDGFADTSAITNSGNSLTTAVSGQLATDNINILYGSETLSVERGSGTTNLEVLQHIADQINLNTPDINGLRARIVNFGTSSKLIIAPTNINQSVTFSGLSLFRNQLGLDDSKNIAAFIPDPDKITLGRFATLKQLADNLNDAGVTTNINYSESLGTNITLTSTNPVAFNNYQPFGKGSDFLTEFGIKSGYVQSDYDPYDATRNIAGGSVSSHFSQNITIFDSMGNQQNLMMAFLKTNINEWAVEVYATDKLSVNIAGRTDGLLMAGTVTFDGKGRFQGIKKATQYGVTKDLLIPNQPLGATKGQTFTIGVGAVTHTYTYGNLAVTTPEFTESGTDLVGTSTDTLDITIGSSTYNIERGTGANNLEVLKHIAAQINATSGSEAIYATIAYDGLTSRYKLTLVGADSTLPISFSQTGTLGTNIGITSASDVGSNAFSSLQELVSQINTSEGPNAVRAEIVNGSIKNSYRIKVWPQNSNFHLAFGGSTDIIAPPLGMGANDKISNLLGFADTSTTSQLKGLDEDIVINWSSTIGADPNTISIDWGIFGGTDGLGQVSGNYSIKTSDQNGVSTGSLSGIQINPDGSIIASFSNSQTRKIYQIPIATFANVNGLIPLPGNVFMIGKDSGAMNMKEAGVDGAGTFMSGSLEGSNVDIATELSKLIFAQRQYQASSKVINIVDSLLEELVHRTFG